MKEASKDKGIEVASQYSFLPIASSHVHRVPQKSKLFQSLLFFLFSKCRKPGWWINCPQLYIHKNQNENYI